MTDTPVQVLLIAVGGYGDTYVTELLGDDNRGRAQIVGIVDPFADTSPRIDDLKALNIPIYDTTDEFYQNHSAELAVVSSPIHLHRPHTIAALQHGSHVLCEKPLAGAVQDARAMIDARDAAGKFVAIGYQWSYNDQIQELKKDIMSGRLGKPLRLKTLLQWPRDEAYYTRSSWAGKKRMDNSAWVLDSPANNATAHYLHNMLYVLGDSVSTSAIPIEVTAELYRANPIENYDTAMIRCMTDAGTEILFYTTHATSEKAGPVFEYTFENAAIKYDIDTDSVLCAQFSDGSEKQYEKLVVGPGKKLWDCVQSVRTGDPIVCGIEAARSQTLCINGAQESCPNIMEFPTELIQTSILPPAWPGQPDRKVTHVTGLEGVLRECYEKNTLPSENGVTWAKAGEKINLKGYAKFPSSNI